MKDLNYSLLMPLSKNTVDNKTNMAVDSDVCMKELDVYLQNFKEYCLSLNQYDMTSLLIAEQDWIKRSKNNRNISNSLIGKILKVDFGKTYLLENGYIHYAVCISECNGKYCVIPMTTATDEIKVAFHPNFRPNGEKRLYLLKKRDGNIKDSALYINDMKYISSGRIIDAGNKISEEAFENIINLCCEVMTPKIFQNLYLKEKEIMNIREDYNSLQEKYTDLQEKYDQLKKNNDILCKMLDKKE